MQAPRLLGVRVAHNASSPRRIGEGTPWSIGSARVQQKCWEVRFQTISLKALSSLLPGDQAYNFHLSTAHELELLNSSA